MSDEGTCRIHSPAAMERLGATLGKKLDKGCVIFLTGDLGAGKTTLVRGLLRSLGHEGTVVSPTFTLLETYEVAKLRVVHLDLYRLEDPFELEQLAFRDYLDERSLFLIEWADRARDALPKPDCELRIAIEPDGQRSVSVETLVKNGNHPCIE